jgi:O-glycosyl hydrolase
VLNYDRLVDTPMEISAECALDQFRERDKTFRIAVHPYGEEASEFPHLLAKLAEGVKKIVSSEMAMMNTPQHAVATHS